MSAKTIEKLHIWSGKARIRRNSVPLSKVPPFCYLRPGRTPEDAALMAVTELGLSHPLDALTTLWKLRAIGQAEHSSAQTAPESRAVSAKVPDATASSPKSTHKRGAK